MIEVRREDGELFGHVRHVGDGWEALVVFGAVLAAVPTMTGGRCRTDGGMSRG